MANKNKKEKDYSSSYEKGISINPMTDAFSMDEDKPSIAGAIGRGAKQVPKELSRSITKEAPNQGKLMDEFVKTRTGHSSVGDATIDAAKTAGALGVGYVAGRSDERPSSLKKMSDADMEDLERSIAGVSPEQYSRNQSEPLSRGGYKDGGEIHVTKGHNYIKDLIK